jgi:hypothetical protein
MPGQEIIDRVYSTWFGRGLLPRIHGISPAEYSQTQPQEWLATDLAKTCGAQSDHFCLIRVCRRHGTWWGSVSTRATIEVLIANSAWKISDSVVQSFFGHRLIYKASDAPSSVPWRSRGLRHNRCPE